LTFDKIFTLDHGKSRLYKYQTVPVADVHCTNRVPD